MVPPRPRLRFRPVPLSLAAVTLLLGPAGAATITIQASQDSYVQQDSAASNFGSATTIQVKSQSSAVKRALVKFDLSGVPACAAVTAASVQMRIETNTQSAGGDDHVHGIYRVTAPWTENGVTWTNRDIATAWSTAGGDVAAAPTATATAPAGTGWLVQWNVTADVAAFRAGSAVNHGWLVRDQGEATPPTSSSGYSSKQNVTLANRPVLVLTVTGNDAGCNDANPCTVDLCDPVLGCQNAPGNVGTVCRAATDLCDAAETCTGSSTSCPADALRPSSFQCRGAAGACDVAEFCSGASVVCPPDGKSTAVCRPATGTCDVPESCDGVANGCPADGLVGAGVVCRAASGICDVAETCTGSSPTCPVDGFAATSVVCRASAGTCDPAESCTGSGVVCPPDGKSTAVCRPAVSSCDGPESCDGVGNDCPADVVAASGTICRAAAGGCDVAETCNGVSGACPADVLQPSGAVCRAAAGTCDVAEACNGGSAACPPDALVAGGTPCRASAGVCDPAEACSGSAAACPADAKSTAVCRASAGACDAAETCDGVGAGCPVDALSASGTVCRPASGPCDAAEVCNGASGACPADALATSGTVCRVAGGTCDVAETCDGATAICPPDVLRPGGFSCRAAAGTCDVAESCTGASPACPGDGFLPASTVCRPAANTCDGAETCSGASAACPADTGFADGDGDGVCDTLDDCPTVADPAQVDNDDDGLGDECDPCTHPVQTVRPKLRVTKLLPPTGDDKLKLKGIVTLPYPFDPALDPVARGVRVVLADAAGNTVLDVAVPGGAFDAGTATGWKVTGGTFRWKNGQAVPDPALHGITKVVLIDASARAAGMLKYSVTGKRGSYDAFTTMPLPARGTVVVDAPVARTGQCAEASFPGPIGLAPSCAFNSPELLICK